MKLSKKTKCVMTDRINWLKGWLRIRDYDIGEKRQDFIFVYYCTTKSRYDPKTAKMMVNNANQGFTKPLPNDIVQSTIRAVDAAGGYRLTNQTIIDTLGITPAEVDELRIGHNLKEKAARTQRQLDRFIKDEEIIKQYEDGKRIVDIAAAFPTLSKRTIERIVQAHAAKKKQERDRTIWQLADAGDPASAIAKQVNCSLPTVRRVLSGTKPTELTKKESLRNEGAAPSFIDPIGKELFSLYSEEAAQAVPEDYAQALSELQTTRLNVRIVGTGGTGKTQLIKDYLQSLPPSERSGTLLVAPTGLAASHIGGETIHKVFGLLNEVQTKETPITIPPAIMPVKRLIIDEVSMLRIDIFDRVISILQHIEELEHRRIQVIVLGDFGQLQPVCTIEDRKLLRKLYPTAKGIYAFHSPLWDELDFQTIVLKYNFRQEERELAEQLTALKYGSLEAVQWFNLHCCPFTDNRAVYICPKNEDVEKHNREALERFEGQKITAFKANYKELALNTELPCPSLLQLAEGMRIMTIVNDRKYKNGSIGTILKVKENSIRVLFDNCKTATIRRKRFTLPDGSVYEQLPVVLAYAFTVHKCQGCTFDSVVIVPGFFAAGQLYTALSRCRSLDGLCIEGNITKEDLIIDTEALRMTV